MHIQIFPLLLGVFILVTPFVSTGAHEHPRVDVDIIDEQGHVFPVFAAGLEHDATTYRRYLEAIKGKKYAIRVRNNGDSKIGLVIAVDGRNIISGKKSWLEKNERMYVLGPWQSASYEGWRTSGNLINRFYFTDAEDSYAGAWKDYSAMGVIALAVFEEINRQKRLPRPQSSGNIQRNDAYGDSGRSIESVVAGKSLKKESTEAGTGFGEEKFSPARLVNFSPQQHAAEKHFLKYEWRSALCSMGVLQCLGPPQNRFWPKKLSQRGFVKPPPGS